MSQCSAISASTLASQQGRLDFSDVQQLRPKNRHLGQVSLVDLDLHRHDRFSRRMFVRFEPPMPICHIPDLFVNIVQAIGSGNHFFFSRHHPKVQFVHRKNSFRKTCGHRFIEAFGPVGIHRHVPWPVCDNKNMLDWLGLLACCGKKPNVDMGASKNMGTPPKSSILIGFGTIINHPFWGTPILGNIHMFLSTRPYRPNLPDMMLWFFMVDEGLVVTPLYVTTVQ